MNISIKEDLWSYLARSSKNIVIYGMGNGADKVVKMCNLNNIEVSDFYASDAFVRGQYFHGKIVMTYDQIKQKYGNGNFISLLSFATKLPDVIENIKRIATENELYAPDVPVFGENIFNLNFFNKYREDMEFAYNILSDDISKKAYESIISYKLSGNIDYLFQCDHKRSEMFESILHPNKYRVFADLGAYNGDTIRELLNYSPNLKYVFAMEPDKKTFKKLDHYAETEKACKIAALNMAAWSDKNTLSFDNSGNRNSNITNNGKVIEVEADSLDNITSGLPVDYIKYDVEGSEMQAILGSSNVIKQFSPELCVSLYHRSEDIFLLPALINHLNPNYKLYLRRGTYLPAWDINLIATK